MKLIAGLGNPGSSYENHRHNVGFMVLDKLFQSYEFSSWQEKFKAKISMGFIRNEKILLVKPQNFMNLSGIPICQILNFYKIPLDDLIIIHDELDLPFCKIRLKKGGSSGGHNGLKSIDSHCGNLYQRIRIGIDRPNHLEQVASYVLSPFSKNEEEELQNLLEDIARYFPFYLQKDTNTFLNKISISFQKK